MACGPRSFGGGAVAKRANSLKALDLGCAIAPPLIVWEVSPFKSTGTFLRAMPLGRLRRKRRNPHHAGRHNN